ncbi:hypothetical protein SAMN04488118_102509 [Epibacterium ulvae]|uniref:Peptidase U49 n=1 Tax=Epibacterium ulvae TaxID=1156985 RepID=A0A1G5Q3V2_9RHOB|nr:hypothetical protein [Epibacterium ulvae]SCZ55979.1 hypothetical protein SAMN04488118_102509 [Epibacterium ulvae]
MLDSLKTYTLNPRAYCDAILEKALSRYAERIGVAFPASVTISSIETKAFWAVGYPVKDGLKLEVTTGALGRIQAVWEQALRLSATLPPEQQIALLGHPDHAVETSFSWLLQHELNHHAIGHFSYLDGMGLAEGKSPYGLGVVQRTGKQRKPKPHGLNERELADLHMCLELQTDHDAIEIVLGAYSAENWPLFRYYATCILVVMFIIEAEERRLDEPLRHHPLAATRLFQLIGHLVELPTIPAIKRAYEEKLDHLPAEYLPTADELVAYRSEVVAPVMATLF